MNHSTSICKWGNSLALRLPRSVADSLHFEEGTTVSIDALDGTLVIKPVRKKYTLAELLKGHPEPATYGASGREYDWGAAVGKEEW